MAHSIAEIVPAMKSIATGSSSGKAASPLLKKLPAIVNMTGDISKNLFLIAFGSLAYVVGVNGILVPQGFLNGGVFGVCLIFHYLFPGIGLGLLNAAFNIPLFMLGLMSVSRKFIAYTFYGIIAFSLMVEYIQIPPLPIQDPMLAAIMGGVICGFGGGTVLRSAGSAGGLDILAVYLYKKFDLRPGMTSFAVNSMIMVAAAVIFNLEMALYTLIFVFVSSKVTDTVITGFNKRKSIMIISDKYQEIADAIMNSLHRGATFLDGTGAYSGQHKKVVFSVITLTELARIKDLVFNIDPGAFVVINDTLDVVGSTLGRRRVY